MARKDIYLTDVKDVNIILEEIKQSPKAIIVNHTLKEFVPLTYKNVITILRENLVITVNRGKSTYQYHFNLNGEIKVVVNPRVVYATFKKYVHFKDVENPFNYSSSGILYYNDAFEGEHKAYSYDLNSSYSNAMLNCDYPDVDQFVGTNRIVGDDEIGFVDSFGNVKVIESGRLATYVYKKLPRDNKLYKDIERFVRYYYSMKSNAQTPIEKQYAKDFLNFSIGCLQNHNWLFRTCILSYANKIITDLIEKYEEHVIYCNTDNITLDIPIDLNIGKDIGQFKIEHYDENVKLKGTAVQWKDKLSYRGVTGCRLKDDFDILKDKVEYTKPQKYYFDEKELKLYDNH